MTQQDCFHCGEPVPADITVGVGRAATKQPCRDNADNQEKKKMNPEEIAKLYERAASNGINADKVTALITEDATVESVRSALDRMIVDKQRADIAERDKEIEKLRTAKPKKPEAPKEPETVPPLGGSREEEQKLCKRFSIMNVMRSLAGMKADVGFEREVSDECAKLRGKPAEGIIIPFAALAKRDLTVSGTSSATVATDLYAAEYIDLLRNAYVLGKLGVRFLTGLVGNVAIPKMSAGATGYWVSEGSDITESTPTLGQVTGSPHTCGALVDVSRKLLMQSTPDAEMLVRDELVQRVMRTVQIAVFAGTGADGQPSAITNASGINNPTVTEGTPTYAEVLDFPGNIMADSAQADGQKWAMTAEVWAKLADTDIDSGSGRKVLNPESKKCIGYDYEVCEDLPANSLWFGNWNSVVVGIWGNGIDVATTDSQLFASGGLTVRAMQDVDVMVRLGQALAYNTAVTA